MVFDDTAIDCVIFALLEAECSNNSPDSFITYSDYRSMMERIYPRLLSVFDMFYIQNVPIDVMAKELKVSEENINLKINKLRGFTVIYLLKQVER